MYPFYKQLFNNSNFVLSPLLSKEEIMDSMTLMLLDKQKPKILCNVQIPSLGYESSIHSRHNQSEVGRNSYILLFLPVPHAYSSLNGHDLILDSVDAPISSTHCCQKKKFSSVALLYSFSFLTLFLNLHPFFKLSF